MVGAALGIRRVRGESHSSRGVRLMAVRCPLDAWSAGIAFLMAGLCDEFLCKHLSVFQGNFFFLGFLINYQASFVRFFFMSFILFIIRCNFVI